MTPSNPVLGTTKLYGILGHPVHHTLSPVMQNAAFQAAGINAVYIPFPVAPDNLEKVLKMLPDMGIAGVNITVPHKQAAVTVMDTLSEEAKLVCAVNTVVYKGNKLHGHNTDGEGFIKSLEEEGNFKAKGKKALVLGAGGAARAVSVALAKAGVKELYIYNRTRERAELLAQHIDHHFAYCTPKVLEEYQTHTKEDLEPVELVVNATSLGLQKEDPLPISPMQFKPGTLFYDLIYHGESNWIKMAKQTKMKTLSGLGMLVYQGALSFELWTGKKAPVDAMRQALEKQLCLSKEDLVSAT